MVGASLRASDFWGVVFGKQRVYKWDYFVVWDKHLLKLGLWS